MPYKKKKKRKKKKKSEIKKPEGIRLQQCNHGLLLWMVIGHDPNAI
jgi:hypothetical protein